MIFVGVQSRIERYSEIVHKIANIQLKASVTIVADFGPEFNPPFRWRSKHQTKKNHNAYQ